MSKRECTISEKMIIELIELLGDFNSRVLELNKKVLFENENIVLENNNYKVFFKHLLAFPKNKLSAAFSAKIKKEIEVMAASAVRESISVEDDPNYTKFKNSSEETMDMITRLQDMINGQLSFEFPNE